MAALVERRQGKKARGRERAKWSMLRYGEPKQPSAQPLPSPNRWPLMIRIAKGSLRQETSLIAKLKLDIKNRSKAQPTVATTCTRALLLNFATTAHLLCPSASSIPPPLLHFSAKKTCTYNTWSSFGHERANSCTHSRSSPSASS